jgi:hypothetical protein
MERRTRFPDHLDQFHSVLYMRLLPQKLSCPFTQYGSMVMTHSGLLVILLLAAGLVMVSGCTSSSPPVTVSPTQTPPLPATVTTTPPPALQDCMSDDDCVPAECCHPTSCINKANKGVCTLLCTDVCQGPIDCGAGSCGCVNGKCSVIASGVSLTPTKYQLP